MALGPKSIWATLGVPATRDSREIRRAYARQLKSFSSADDPERFQALRAAYERALGMTQDSVRAGGTPPRSAHFELERAADVTPDEQPEDPGETPTDPAVLPPEPQAPIVTAKGVKRPARADRRSGPAGTNHVDRAPEAHSARGPLALTLRPKPQPVGVAPDEVAQLRATLDRLTGLTREGAAPEALSKAFDEIIRSPALESIVVRERTERWFVGFLLQVDEKAESLLGLAITAFGWDRGGVIDPALGSPIVARHQELRFISGLTASHRDHRDAWKALTRPTTPIRQLTYRCNLTLFGEVRALLAIVDATHPGLANRCDAQALRWWREVLKEPGFGPTFVWLTIAGIVLGALGVFVSRTLGPLTNLALLAAGAISLLIAPVITTAVLLGLVRPRSRWRAGSRIDAPSWQAFGWAGMLPFLAVAEALPTNGLVLAGLALVIALGGGWAWVTSDPDGKARWWFRFYLVPIPITPTIARGLTTLPILISCLSEKDRGPLALSLLGLVCLYAVGGATLQRFWRQRFSVRVKGMVMTAMACLAAVTALPLWWIGGAPQWTPLALGWTHLLYLAALVAGSDLEGPIRTTWIAWISLGWVLCPPIAIAAANAGQGQSDLLAFGLWLLGAAAISALGVLHRERSVLRAAFARAG